MLTGKQTQLQSDFQRSCEMILKRTVTFSQKAKRLNKAYENRSQGRGLFVLLGGCTVLSNNYLPSSKETQKLQNSDTVLQLF